MSDSPSSSFFTLIPRVFYDIIGRLIPGFTIIASGYVVLRGWEGAVSATTLFLSDSHVSVRQITVIAALLGIASYVLAMLLSGIADAMHVKEGLARRLIKCRGDELRTRFTMELWHAGIGDRLTKLRAERAMCDVLIVGWSGLGIACAVEQCVTRRLSAGSFVGTEAVLIILVACSILTQVSCRCAYIRRLNVCSTLRRSETTSSPVSEPDPGDADEACAP